MIQNINIPYVKQYDEEGKLTNPITGMYKTTGMNRKQRRQYMQKNKKIK